jgi:hypothetical protein
VRIEFVEPVDIRQTPDEIVRQVFENRSYWRMCNRAMAAIYEMPADVDFGQQPVRLYWPRSPANEEFVRRLIEAEFHVDGALSVDRRHDGSPAYVENDVRASIHNGRMLRMWAACATSARAACSTTPSSASRPCADDAVPDAAGDRRTGPAAVAQRRLRADLRHHPCRQRSRHLDRLPLPERTRSAWSCPTSTAAIAADSHCSRISSARAWPGVVVLRPVGAERRRWRSCIHERRGVLRTHAHGHALVGEHHSRDARVRCWKPRPCMLCSTASARR